MSLFRRTIVAKWVVLGIALAGLHSGLKPAQGASPTPRASMLKPDERATLLQYARDTWRGFDKLLLPSSLPADGLRRQGAELGSALDADFSDRTLRPISGAFWRPSGCI